MAAIRDAKRMRLAGSRLTTDTALQKPMADKSVPASDERAASAAASVDSS
jgi:hypothetical protein